MAPISRVRTLAAVRSLFGFCAGLPKSALLSRCGNGQAQRLGGNSSNGHNELLRT